MTTKPNKNTHFKVKNLNGTTGLKCGCGSWIAHWRNYTGSVRSRCAVAGCTSVAVHGAHVKSVDKRTDSRWWIAPFCARHNNTHFKDEVYLNQNVILVSANKEYTCG